MTRLQNNGSQESNNVTLKLDSDKFSAALDLSVLGLDKSYGLTGKSRTIKNLSVTLPTLLGPYQDIEATLSLGNDFVTLSHSNDDSGLFVTDFNDPRFLPFEGADATKGTLTLTIFDAATGGKQRKIVEDLNDVIFHIRYVIK